MTATLNDVAAQLRQTKAGQQADYREAVAAFAANKGYDAAETTRILTAAGKTLDDLQADVREAQTRASKRAEKAKEPTMLAERQRCYDAMEAANKRLQDAIELHRQECAPHQLRIGEINQHFLSVGNIDKELFESCQDEELRNQYHHLRRQVTGLDGELRQAQNTWHTHRTARENELMRCPGVKTTPHDASERRTREALDALQRRRSEVIEQMNDVYQAMVLT